MAAGIPVAQPRHAAFPELIAATGGGVLCDANDPDSLADALEELLLNPERARTLGGNGRRGARAHYGIETMAARIADLCGGLVKRAPRT